MSEINVIPEDLEIEITDESAAQTFKRKKLRAGVMKMRCTRATSEVAKTGSFVTKRTWAPVDEDDNVRGPTFVDRLTYPFANPEFVKENGQPHTAPNTANICYGYLKAVDTETPLRARWQPDTKNYETPDGDFLDPEDGKLYNAKVNKDLLFTLRDRLKDADLFIGDECYIRVAYSTTGWPEAKFYMADAPADEEVIVDNFAEVE